MAVRYAKVTFRSPFQYSLYDRRRRASEETKKTKSEVIRALTDPRDRKLRQALASCGYNKEERCNLSICPVCVERTQRALIVAAAECFDEVFKEGDLPIIAVEADLPSQRYELGEMFKFHLPSLNREIQGQYTEAGFPLVFSGLRMSLIEDEYSKTELWQARICSVIVGVPRRDIAAAIRDFYPHQSIKRRGDLDAGQALESTIEPRFFRNFTSNKADGSTDDWVRHLRERLLRELAVCLSSFTMPERYFLTGGRLEKDSIELNPRVQKRLKESAARRDGHVS